jgi:hypothetical protein
MMYEARLLLSLPQRLPAPVASLPVQNVGYLLASLLCLLLALRFLGRAWAPIGALVNALTSMVLAFLAIGVALALLTVAIVANN